MKIPINLASQPFRRDRAVLAAFVAATLILLGTLGTLITLIVADRALLADVRTDVNSLNRQIRTATWNRSGSTPCCEGRRTRRCSSAAFF